MPDQTVLELPWERADRLAGVPEQEVELGLRPEHFMLHPGQNVASLQTVITLLQPAGPRVFTSLRIVDKPVRAEFSAREGLGQGNNIRLRLDLARALVLDPVSGQALGT